MQMQSISHWGMFGDERQDDSGTSITVLTCHLSMRADNCIRREGIATIEQLRALDDRTMLRWMNFGRKSLREVREILADFDQRPEWYLNGP